MATWKEIEAVPTECWLSSTGVMPAHGKFMLAWVGRHRGWEMVVGGQNGGSSECKGGMGRVVQEVDQAQEGCGTCLADLGWILIPVPSPIDLTCASWI